MVSLLKRLLGKSARPIIVCGKLFMDDRTMYLARLESWQVVFSTSRHGSFVEAVTYDHKLDAMVRDFEAHYGKLLQGYRSAEDEERHARFLQGESSESVDSNIAIHGSVDPFTGAVCLETDTYRELVAARNHELGKQFTSTQETLLREFTVKQLHDYYEIFINLLNKRLVAQHMPIMIKCHMVKGLFQPIIVETPNIVSPLRYGEALWLYSLLQPNEVFLERQDDGIRKLNLSCEAMCDIASTFGIDPVRELDRRQFMLMMCLTCLRRLDPDSAKEMYQRYGYFTRRIMESGGAARLFARMQDFARNTSLKVVQ